MEIRQLLQVLLGGTHTHKGILRFETNFTFLKDVKLVLKYFARVIC
jgi:hypothetical protein